MFRMSLRILTKKILRRLGYGVWSINSTEFLNFENLLYAILRKYESLSFLHLGAHDGKSFSDPLYNFVSKNSKEVSGIMVEPVPATFAELVKNLGHLPNVRLLNAAAHPYLKQVVIHQIVSVDRGASKILSGKATIEPARLDELRHINKDAVITETKVAAYSIHELVAQLPDKCYGDVQVLLTDVEGLDFELLESIDFQKIKPLLIRFEHNLCLLLDENHRKNFDRLVRYLNSYGYQVFTEHNDAVAISQEMINVVVEPWISM